MNSIWKYELPTTDTFDLALPAGTTVLTIDTQDGTPCMWAQVDPSAEPVARSFRTYGTGHPVDLPPEQYRGTYQLRGGLLIFHVYEALA